MLINKVVLVNPPFPIQERYQGAFKNVGTILPKLGILYIASALENVGFEVDFVDATLEGCSIEETCKRVMGLSPDLIGITTETPNIYRSTQLAESIKRHSSVPIVFGGPHPTLLPEDVLESKAIDFVVIGEGEVTIVDLINTLNSEKCMEEMANVKGIGYRNKGNNVILTEKRERVNNLDTISFPARHLLDIDRYKPTPHQYKRLPVLNMITSRGCPFACTYCSASNIWRRRYTVRSVDNVISEIVHVKRKYGAKEIAFWDDLWGVNEKWAEEFCDKMITEKIDINWSCECRVDTVSESLLIKMAVAGCWKIFYGLESLDEEILTVVNKNINLGKINAALSWTRNAGIEVHGNFILGLPKETPEKVNTMIEKICKLPLDYVKFNFLTPYPGTVLYNEIKNGRWGTFNEKLDKLTLHHATFLPSGYTDYEELDRLRKLVVRKFYFRLSYMLERLLSIRTLYDIKRYYEGLIALMGV